jgi:hypothetical protein
MMWIDQINGWLLKRLGNRSSAQVVLSPDRVRWRSDAGEQFAAWTDVWRVVAFQRSTLGGDIPSLAFELGDGQVVENSAEWDGWTSLVSTLDQYLPGALPYERWMPQLLASDSEQAITVFVR